MTWVVARPAWAAGPSAALCDDRGASAIAPPPTFEATDDAIRQTLADGCGAGAQSLFASVVPARSAGSQAGHSADPALPLHVTLALSLASVPIVPTPLPATYPRSVSFELDHPPD
jgi:hypothetical protein